MDKDRDSEQKGMVRRVTSAVQALGAGTSEQRISGLFISDDYSGNQPDAENITFYYFGDAPFRFVPPTLAVERSYAVPPPSPKAFQRLPRYYHRWWFERADAPWTTWSAIGEPVAEWMDVSLQVPASIDDLGLHAWLAVRDASDRVTVRESLGENDLYGVVARWAVPEREEVNVAKAVKGLVDGPVAALQRADDLPEPVIDRLLRRRWPLPMPRARLLSLVRAHVPPRVFPGPPFNLNGLNPYDKRCVAGRVEIRRSVDASATMRGRFVRVALR
jgi:hypothetical protein